MLGLAPATRHPFRQECPQRQGACPRIPAGLALVSRKGFDRVPAQVEFRKRLLLLARAALVQGHDMCRATPITRCRPVFGETH